jgi:tol-pal system protein YbgF
MRRQVQIVACVGLLLLALVAEAGMARFPVGTSGNVPNATAAAPGPLKGQEELVLRPFVPSPEAADTNQTVQTVPPVEEAAGNPNATRDVPISQEAEEASPQSGEPPHERKTPSATQDSRPVPPSPKVSASLASNPESLYQAAMAAYQARRHAQARQLWTELIRRHPQTPLAPNARYWIGETWYAQGRYLQAIWTFEAVLHFHPRHPKAADALFKIALCRQRLGEGDVARILWRRVVGEYPGTPAAHLACQRLGELCPR